jgi:hypothetical protein
LVNAGAGTDPAYQAHYFFVTCLHEIGHLLSLSVQGSNLHDAGNWPNAEFRTDQWNTPKQSGLMFKSLPTPTYWIRHEDWQQANYYAGQFLQ